MIIQTLDKKYYVVEKREMPLSMFFYICNELTEQDENSFYGIVQIKDPALCQKMIPVLMEQQENTVFEELVECFTQQDALCVVFHYHRLESLKSDIDGGERTFRERLEIGKNIIEQMIKSNLNTYFQMEAASLEHLVLDESLEVFVNYNLKNSTIYDQVTLDMVQRKMAETFLLLFEKECKEDAIPKLKEWINALDNTSYENLMNIYQEYKRLYEEYVALDEEGKVKPKNVLFSLWERIKAISRHLKKAIAILFLAAIFIYLIYIILVPAKKEAVGEPFKVIGSVNIQEKNSKEKVSEENSEDTSSEKMMSEGEGEHPANV